MKKVIWFTGIFVVVFMLVTGCYLLFFREGSSKVPEGTFVRAEYPERRCAAGCKCDFPAGWEYGFPGGWKCDFAAGRKYDFPAGMEGTWDLWRRSA